ncbi:MAG: glycosyltransferase [Thermodesulfovibrionales bacterium]
MSKAVLYRIAFVVATKDRPDDLRRMLKSLSEQSYLPEQVVIVDSSVESADGLTREFAALNILYIKHNRASASMQRNVGIHAVDPKIDLIGFLDDDIELDPGAMECMIKFWNNAPENIGGCAFNLKNYEPSGENWLKQLIVTRWLGLYSREKGVVLPSGWQTMIGTITEDIFVQWLSSTASVWRSSLFKEFLFDEFFDGYSYLEDLDFSYGVGKKYRLVVVADAKYNHYPLRSGRVNAYLFGKIEVVNRLYFVNKYEELSLTRCFLGLFVRMLLNICHGAVRQEMTYFKRALGNCFGLLKYVLRFILMRQLKFGTKQLLQ